MKNTYLILILFIDTQNISSNPIRKNPIYSAILAASGITAIYNGYKYHKASSNLDTDSKGEQTSKEFEINKALPLVLSSIYIFIVATTYKIFYKMDRKIFG
jgi:hypothetical protein